MTAARAGFRTAGAPRAGPRSAGRPRRALLSDGSPALLARLGVEDTAEVLGLHQRLSEWLADAVPEIAEIEVNPLMVTAEHSLALDVRIRIEPLPA